MPRGTLFLVVGPSGVGKDTLIEGAKRALADDPRFVFPRRVITRVPDGGAEHHEPCDPDEFLRLEREGAFALAWEAHGQRYGIPRAIEDELATARHVVANVSRTVIAPARRRYQPLAIVDVWAPVSVLAERLAARGRERAEGIAERLERSSAIAVEGPEVRRVENAGSVELGVKAFLKALV